MDQLGKTHAAITAVGGFVPENKRTNDFLATVTETSDEWIVKRTGIKERRILEEGLGTSDMVVKAIEDLLTKVDFSIQDVDCLIVATSTPDMPMPATANIVLNKLGIKNAWGFDINSACSGFLYALNVGASLIESGRYERILVAGADKMSSVIDLYDRKTNILFGDGAGVVLLQKSTSGNGVLQSLMESNGEGKDYLNIEGGGSLFPATEETLTNGKHYIRQEGKIVFKHAVEKMSRACKDLLRSNDLSIEAVDWLVPHQANLRIIDAVGKEIGIETSKTLVNLQHYGNTTSGTIPLCLWDYQDKLKTGDLILMTAFGAGFSWGSTLVRWGN